MSILSMIAAGAPRRHGWWMAGAAMLAFAAAPASAQQADGARTYATVCSSCHMADGAGVAGVFPPVAESEWVTGSPEKLVKIILHGVMGEMMVAGEMYTGMMPPWGGGLNDAEVAAVATYIRTHFGNEASPVTTEMVANLRKEYASRNAPWTSEELSAAP